MSYDMNDDIMTARAMEEDINSFDDEMDDMQKSIDGNHGGGVSSALREFEGFDAHAANVTGGIIDAAAEGAEMITAAAPEGVFDTFDNAMKMWSGEHIWEDEQTESVMKHTYGQQDLRMMTLSGGGVEDQYTRDLRMGTGLSQELMDTVNFQKRTMLVGAAIGVGAMAVGGGALFAGSRIGSTLTSLTGTRFISTLTFGGIAGGIEQATGYGIGVCDSPIAQGFQDANDHVFNTGSDTDYSQLKSRDDLTRIDYRMRIERDEEDIRDMEYQSSMSVSDVVVSTYDTPEAPRGEVTPLVFIKRSTYENGKVVDVDYIHPIKYHKQYGDEVGGFKFGDIRSIKDARAIAGTEISRKEVLDNVKGLKGFEFFSIDANITDIVRYSVFSPNADTLQFHPLDYVDGNDAPARAVNHVWIERTVTRGDIVLGVERISLEKYTSINGDTVGDVNLGNMRDKSGIYSDVDGKIINNEDTDVLVHVNKVDITNKGNEFATYTYKGHEVDEDLPLHTDIKKSNYLQTVQYELPTGTVIYTEIHEMKGDDIFKPSVASIQMNSLDCIVDDVGNSAEENVRATIISKDLNYNLVSIYKSRKLLNDINNEITQLRICDQMSTPIMMALQSLTFTTGSQPTSPFDALSLAVDAPFIMSKSNLSFGQTGVMNRMEGLTAAIDVLIAGAIGGAFAKKGLANLPEKNPTESDPILSGNSFGIGNTQHSEQSLLDEDIIRRNWWESHEEIHAFINDTKDGLKEKFNDLNFVRVGDISERNLWRNENGSLFAKVSETRIANDTSVYSDVFKDAVSSGMHRVKDVILMQTVMNMATGKTFVDTESFGISLFENAKNMTFDSTYQGLIQQISTLAYRTPILSGLLSGKTLTIAVMSLSLRDIRSSFKNVELQKIREEYKAFTAEFNEEDFERSVNEANEILKDLNLEVDSEKAMENGYIHAEKITRTDGFKVRERGMVTTDKANLHDKHEDLRHSVISRELHDIQNIKRLKFEMSLDFLADEEHIIKALQNNPSLTKWLGLGIGSDGNIYSRSKWGLSTDTEPLRHQDLASAVMKVLSEGNLKSHDFKIINPLFSTDETFVDRLQNNEKLSSKLGIAFSKSGDVYDINDTEYLRADIGDNALSMNEIRQRGLNFIDHAYGGISNRSGITEEMQEDYNNARNYNYSNNDDIDMSNVKTSNIELTNTGSGKSFWKSMVILSMWGTKDPFNREGQDLQNAFVLRPNIHNTNMTHQMFSSFDTGIPMSFLGMTRGMLSHDTEYSSWFENMIHEKFTGIRDNTDLDEDFFGFSDEKKEYDGDKGDGKDTGKAGTADDRVPKRGAT